MYIHTVVNPGHGIAPFEQKRIIEPISDCVNGDIRAVKTTLFVRGRLFDGKTTLISAAAEQNPEMISLLIKHGAELNAVDNYGRSASMEAALFGWVDNVKVLLEHNADRYMKDSENRVAIDFAREHHRNRQERYERVGGDLMPSTNRRLGYVEDTFKRDIDRQEIVRLLSGENRKSKIVFGSPPILSLSKSYSYRDVYPKNILLVPGNEARMVWVDFDVATTFSIEGPHEQRLSENEDRLVAEFGEFLV